MSEFPREVVEERLSPLRDTLVVDGYDQTVMLIMFAIGALAGAIGSGIAASRFLDV